eukprot:155109_1
MSLSHSQLSPIQLRNRSVSRHTNQEIPPIGDLHKTVDNYIASIMNTISSMSTSQRIDYFTAKISEAVHICFDIQLPEYNEYSQIIMMRWLLIGKILHHLVTIWKNNEDNVKTSTEYKTLKEWLPYIVKRKLPPNLIEFGSYKCLRRYIIFYENKQLICIIPQLRGEYTHKLHEMNHWLNEFSEKVRIIAVQRDVPIPNDIKQQIQFYKIWKAYHAKQDHSDNENNTSKFLDPIIQQDNINDNKQDIQEIDMEQNDNDNDSNNEQEAKPKLSRHEQQIIKYRNKIKNLKTELSETKKQLKKTQMQHCNAARERHVYRELHREHEEIVNKLNNKIVEQFQQLNKLKENNIQIKSCLIDAKRMLINAGKYIELMKDKSDRTDVMNRISSCSPQTSFGQQSCSEHNISLYGNSCCSIDIIHNGKRKFDTKQGLKQHRKRRRLNDNMIVNVNLGINNGESECESQCGTVSNVSYVSNRMTATKLKKYIKNLQQENAVLRAKFVT